MYTHVYMYIYIFIDICIYIHIYIYIYIHIYVHINTYVYTNLISRAPELLAEQGEVAISMDRMKEYLQAHVDSGRFVCRGCGQQTGADAPVLPCGGCSVARFCGTACQKLASKKVGSRRESVRHRDICALLKKWRHVVFLRTKGKETAESIHPDLLEFLQRDLWWKRQAPDQQTPVSD